MQPSIRNSERRNRAAGASVPVASRLQAVRADRWLRVFVILALCCMGRAHAAVPGLPDDLFGAIVLAGHDCGRIVSVASRGEQNYLVDCEPGRDVLVLVTPQGRLRIVTPEAPEVDIVPDPESHDRTVRRHLFSLINLSRKRCDEVVRVERPRLRTYHVGCRNGLRYRVYRTSAGRVIVQSLN